MAIVPSYFGALAQSQNLQALIDNSLENLYGKSIWRQFLELGTPQVSLTFQAAIGRSRIEAAASIVDPDAAAPLRSRNKIDLYTGEIPSIKEKFRLSQNEMRTLLTMAALPISDQKKKEQLIKMLWNDVSLAAVSGDKRVDIMLLQALSTLSVDVNTTNNPDGVAYGTVDLLPQSQQVQGVPVVWTDAANAKPITDIENYCRHMWNNYGRRFERIVMTEDQWIVFKNTTEVKDMLKTFFNVGKGNAVFAMTLNHINELLTANMLPTIEIINYATGVEKDGVISVIKPWKKENITFLPSGKVGTLMNAFCIEELKPVKDVTYANFDRTLVSKWSTNDPFQEFTGMELNAFPAVDIDSVHILKTDTVQANFI